MNRLVKALASVIAIASFLACGDAAKPTVIVPSGSPQLAQIYVEASDLYRVDTVQGPDPLLAAFGSGSHDFIMAPTNLGAKLYAAKPDYIFVCAVSFGNYYLVTKTDEVFDINSLDGREITVFGANQTSDIIVSYILEQNDIAAQINYVDSIQTATSLFIQDDTRVILTAEPSLSVLKSQIEDLDVIDLQEEYAKLTGTSAYPQAGVFAKASLSKEIINDYLSALADSIASVNADPDQASDIALSLGYPFAKAVIIEAIPGSHLDYQGALEVKIELEAYFSIIMAMNPDLVGGSLPDDDFYYQP